MTKPRLVYPLPHADGAAGMRHVFLRDLVIECGIGVHGHEHGRHQRVRINLDLSVAEGVGPIEDSLANVVDYEWIVSGVRDIAGAGHVKLVETLAERIADFCLGDERIRVARVRVEKLDVYADAAGVGVEIERFSPRS